jgi:DNA-binding response OmpR family regulator
MSEKKAVFLVDDDPALLKMAGELLRADFEVSCAKSGIEAVSLIKNGFYPDLILLDVDMPGINGFNTLRKLREIEAAADIPVIFLTGVNTPDAELEGLSAGGVDYIKKPFVREILLARLKIHLENSLRMKKDNEGTNRRIDGKKLSDFSKDLSETEAKIVHLLALGYTNKEISETLNYSYYYVKKVVGVIYEKKCISKRSEIKKLLV